MKRFIYILTILSLLYSSQLNAQVKTGDEMYRPKIHFSPKEKWMNDPNGMVYYKGVYHLFYQYYPGASVWGPMHWGHATSPDMIHWTHQPIALYPDSLGYIFSGSAVVDVNNTSGFGTKNKPPLVAIFTHHDPAGEKAGRNNYQYQSLAYSNDDGKSWTKYKNNPVLQNPGIADFRDPKVSWYEPQKKWVMTLAVKDHISFYSSKNLKDWKKESDFGEKIGAHGGVWECPDLFQLDHNGIKYWVLIVNLNPGGPNSGSATQYFIGDFNGKNFLPKSTDTKWLDYGPDEYAGVTWSNTGNRRIFFGWMSNWLYGQVVPTETWRSAMTMPRELRIVKTGNEMFVASRLAGEIEKIKLNPVVLNNVSLSKPFDLSTKAGMIKFPCLLNLSLDDIKDFSITISNDIGEELLIGYDKTNNQFFVDRTKSGRTDFNKEFAARHSAPRFTVSSKTNLSLLIDVSSVELFADDGLTVMTEIFFPSKPYNKVAVQSSENAVVKKLEYWKLK